MNRSEEIVRDREVDADRERTRQGIWGAPVGEGKQIAAGMGNLAGWGVSAALIGALLGGIVGQGFGGAIVGGLVFGGGLWFMANVAKRTGAYHRDARPLVWTAGGAAVGVAIGAFVSMTAGGPFWIAVQTWAIFLGGLSGLFCWIARGSARRDVDPDSIKKYNDEWNRKHGYGPTDKVP
ncbi:MAG: hypothetical protein U0Q55_18735 [Vicinamibacterales bacterium]